MIEPRNDVVLRHPLRRPAGGGTLTIEISFMGGAGMDGI